MKKGIAPAKAIVMVASLLAAFVLPLPAAAETPPQRTIRVSGHGSVKTPPDRARVAVSVSTQATSAREATETNARVSKDVLAKLRAAVHEPGEVSTAGYELAPVYDYGRADGAVVRSAPKVVGYTAVNRFAIVSADLAGIGALIDAAVASGANRIDSIEFFLADEESARRPALLEAGRKARSEAETIAQSLDVKLGEVLDASSATSVTPVPVFARSARAMDAAAETQVAPGSLEIGADVTVTFAIP